MGHNISSGKELNESRESQKKISNMSQLAGIKNLEYRSGKAKGCGALEVYNQAGLCFSVLPDQCLDIYDLRFKGLNIGFPSKNGLQNSAAFNALGGEFAYYWRAGMLYTCGLANAGPPCDDNGLWRTQHGRIGMIPADNVRCDSFWKDDDYILSIEGEVTESMLFGSRLKLSRRIETGYNSREIRVSDVLRNLQPADEEFMLLYHVNFGYPLVDEGARLIKGKGGVKPRTDHAAAGLHEWDKVTAPLDINEEQCFFHENIADRNGYAFFGIVNDRLGIGAYVKYTLDTLPITVEWKNMLSHDYVIALEPGNTYIMGRAEERKNGTLPVLTGYGEQRFEVHIGILEGAGEISSFETMLENLHHNI